jgi:glycine/D-amino acid oxidase-like deaminating enzyme
VKGLRIYENTKVTGFGECTGAGERAVFTNRGRITAKAIIVATHFPMLNKHGSYFLKLYQHRSYVLALKNAPKLSGMYVDESKTGLSFRPCGDLLLLGGGSHRTGKKGGNWRELEQFDKIDRTCRTGQFVNEFGRDRGIAVMVGHRHRLRPGCDSHIVELNTHSN